PEPEAPACALALCEAWAAAVQRRAEGAGGGLARAYARLAGRLSRLFLRSLDFQEAASWLARHVRALCAAAVGGPAPWRAPGPDHGALIERIRHALDVAAEALAEEPAPADRALARWLRRLDSILDGEGSGAAAVAAVASLLRAAAPPLDLATS